MRKTGLQPMQTNTLMLTLFFFFFSYSKVDQKKFEQLKQSINKELLKKTKKPV
jgi:flagellar motor protein MotB